MSPVDPAVLAERVAAVERHLARVATKLPERPEDLTPATDASDAVILHLWLAVQIVIDLAVSVCVRSKLGAPETYGEAFSEAVPRGSHRGRSGHPACQGCRLSERGGTRV